MSNSHKFRVLIPFECLFDLRWGFIREFSGLSDVDLFPRFSMYCTRITDDLTTIVPGFTNKFRITPEVVSKSPRTGILSLVSNVYRQYSSERPDDTVTLHLTVDFSSVPFFTNHSRQTMVDALKEAMVDNSSKIHVNHTSTGYENYTIRQLRKNFTAIIVYDIDKFITNYNVSRPDVFGGLGIITRPLFIGGKTSDDFTSLISGYDRRNPLSGQMVDTGDQYEILSDAFSHLGPIYFHEPMYFSAILPK